MAFDGNITIGTTIDTFGINNGLLKIQKAFKKLNKLAALGLGVTAITKLGAAALEAASNLQEVQNIVDVSFGDLSEKMERFSQIAIESYGMSEYAAKRTGSSFMAMGKSMGLSLDEASNMSIRLTALTGDMASFYNISQDYARIALSAVYTGETETLKRYGIILTEANLQQYALSKGIETSVKKMDARSKAILRYNYILEATKDMEGDFVRTQDTWANQVKVLQQRWQQFLIVLGNGLIKVLTPLIKALNMIVAELTRFAQIVGYILSQVFGIQWDTPEEKTSNLANNISDAADAEDDLTEAIEEANKALKKQLQGYDELNNITTKTSTGTDEDLLSGLGVGDIDDLLGDLNKEPSNAIPKWVQNVIDLLDVLKNKLKELADFFELGFLHAWDWLNVDKQIQDIINKFWSIVGHIQDIINACKSHFDNFIGTVAFALGEIVASVISIIASIIQMVLGGIDQFLEENKQRIITYINFVLDTLGAMAIQVANFVKAVAKIVEGIVEPVANLIAQVLGIISTIFMGVTTLLIKLARDILILFTQPIIDNVDNITKVLGDLINFIAERLRTVKETLQEFFDYANKVYDEKIKPVFEHITKGLSEVIEAWTNAYEKDIKPKLDELGRTLNDLLENHLLPFGKKVVDIIGELATSIGILWDKLQPILETKVPEAVSFIIELFDGWVRKISEFLDVETAFITTIESHIKYINALLVGDSEAAEKEWENIGDNAKSFLAELAEYFILQHAGIAKYIGLALGLTEEDWDMTLSYIIDSVKNWIKDIKDSWDKDLADWYKKNVIELGRWIKGKFDDFLKFLGGIVDSIIEDIRVIPDMTGDILDEWVDLFDAAVDSACKLIDKVIKKFEELTGFNIGDAVNNVVGSFGIEIPHLAQGAVIPPNRQFMAVLGDQTSGTNVEAPLSTIQEALYNALMQAGLTGGGNSGEDIVIQIDGREIARAVRREDNIFRKSTGTSMFAY